MTATSSRFPTQQRDKVRTTPVVTDIATKNATTTLVTLRCISGRHLPKAEMHGPGDVGLGLAIASQAPSYSALI